jgi:hypothetical protein
MNASRAKREGEGKGASGQQLFQEASGVTTAPVTVETTAGAVPVFFEL